MRLRLGGLLAVGLVLLTACGGGDDTAALEERIAELEQQLADATSTTVAATTTNTSTSTTTTTEPGPTAEELAAAQFEADVQLIKNLWRGYSDSWFGGLWAGANYTAAHNYPDLGVSAKDCLGDYHRLGWVEGDQEEIVVRADTIEPDPEWRIPAGNQGAGEIPRGRLYIMTMDDTLGAQTTMKESHVTIVGENAYFFFWCHQ